MKPPPSPQGDRLLLIDGHGIIHRAYHAFREPLTVRRTGEIVTAVFGFTNTMLKAFEELQPTHVAVALDAPGPTFRHERDATYKAQRPPMPDDLRAQLDRVREVIDAFNIPKFEIPGWEADDVLGTLARQASERGVETYIATLDSDIVQLIRPNVFVYMYRPYQRDTVVYDAEGVMERYGVPPEAMADLKGLKGDTSDNIAGVPGIGEKTAIRLVDEFGSVAGLYERLEQVTPEKLRENLRVHRTEAEASREMATIDVDAQVELELDACRVHEFDRGRVLELFRDLEFRSLLARLPDYEGMAPPSPEVAAGQPQSPDTVCHTVLNREDLDALAELLRDVGAFAFDTETTEALASLAVLVGLSVSPRRGEAYYLPLGHGGMFEAPQLALKDVVAALGPVFGDASIAKTGHNAKFDMYMLERYGMPVRGVQFDTMIAAYLLGETALGLKTLALERLNHEMTPLLDVIGRGRKQKTMAEVTIEEAAPYACADADMTGRLRTAFEPRLDERGLRPLFEEIEMPLVPVLLGMERVGVAVDTSVLREMSGSLGQQLLDLERQMYLEVGHEFQIGSPQQLSKVLFEELGLPKSRKMQTGYTTDAATLERLRELHPVVNLLLEHRQYAKIKSTYVDTLPGLIDRTDGRVHTTFSQTTAATGRLASSDPNLQNIPVRTELGRQVRRAFVARDVGPDSQLLAADYSQIELRILAHLSGDAGLKEAFRQGEDIHRATASQMYGVTPEDVTADMRRVAKVLNFGVVYGLSGYGLAQRTELEPGTALGLIEAYFTKYPGIRDYIDETIRLTKERGYAETISGRRRYIPEIQSANRQLQASGERMAVNMPVQGSQADLIKIAMIRLDQALRREKLRSRMILQIHDELIFECPGDEIGRMKELALEHMPNALPLSVPVEIALKSGTTWGDLE